MPPEYVPMRPAQRVADVDERGQLRHALVDLGAGQAVQPTLQA